ncbi:hypothetical protein [Paraburkholderia terrae]
MQNEPQLLNLFAMDIAQRVPNARMPPSACVAIADGMARSRDRLSESDCLDLLPIGAVILWSTRYQGVAYSRPEERMQDLGNWTGATRINSAQRHAAYSVQKQNPAYELGPKRQIQPSHQPKD